MFSAEGMDNDEECDLGHVTGPSSISGSAAVNSLILDYYKKFGRKRDLEQYFSLSTAQSDVKDTTGTFWTRMKSENDSSDSGEKKSDSSQELCRISIRCSVPDPCSSQYHAKATKPILTGSALLESLGINIKPVEDDSKSKSESASPPIIIEEATQDQTQNSDDESIKSYGNNSQKSFDILDTSTNKPLSPSSSITSQRKLEWDSLADVGYANESDRKTSASSLSTLERLALKQQYSNNDTKLDSILEPTAHSTPMEENEGKTKAKKGVGKKSTKIHKKDVEYLEVNVPHTSDNNPPQTVNINLTKHISFNVEKDGKVSIENIQKDVSISPEKTNAETAVSPRVGMDKEMQTSLNRTKDSPAPNSSVQPSQKIPVLISLNTLRRQTRRKKLRKARKKLRTKKKADIETIPVQEKSGEQLSDAESFEYMPGHMYNQNQLGGQANERSGNTAGNKSSLESSGLLTTDSSKGSKHSFTKDLEKSIDILKVALQRGGDDSNLRKQLIKKVCERLLKSKYRDDESTSDFLSGLSFNSKKLGLGENHTTTSTSDNSGEKSKRPKKSILRNDKFNARAIASTSQSAPNLPTASNSEKLVTSNLMKNLTTSNTDTDLSNKEKSSSDNVFAKTSSQELYQKYLDALKREENYKRHLKDKEMFLKQKLVCSDSAIKVPTRPDSKVNSRLKDLIKDLTRNNYDDGSGDASKLEGGPNSSRDYDRFVPIKSQRSHSVFTLSSGGNSDHNKQNLSKRLQCDLKELAKPGTSKEHYCCCPLHSHKTKVCGIDSSVQVNIKPPCDDFSCERKNTSPREKCSPRRIEGESPSNLDKITADDGTGDIKYVCLCNNKTIQDVPDNFLVFKCSRLAKGNQESSSKSSNSSCRSGNVSLRKNKDSRNVQTIVECTNENTRKNSPETICEMKTTTKSSQTNFLLKMLRRRSSERSPPSSCDSKKCSARKASPARSKVYEATRWLQTEISINPRIPEPSLSDINIVSNCANLVSEQCRRIAKPSLFNVLSQETCCNSGSSKSSGTSKEIGEIFEDDNAFVKNAKTFEIKSTSQGSNSDRSEKYTIPIQGTNMTLMVSIGSNERKNKPEDMIGQCIGTERNEMLEQGTSLTEECSKGVQYDISPRKVGIIKDQMKNPCIVNTLIVEETAFNTYPKTSPVNEQKPLRRANTDTDNFTKCIAPVNYNKCTKPPENACDDKNECACESFGSKEHCTGNCIEKIKSNQCEIHPIVKKPSVEKETQCSEPNSPKSSCSCAGNIKDCNDNCDERKKSLSQCTCGCSGTKDKCNNKCQCGCSGDKDHCNDKCHERKTKSPKKCSCGCSGTIDKCNRKCEERKRSLTIENVKKLEGSFCSCGCGSEKNKCNKNWDERKQSTSTQCSCGCSGDKDKCNKNSDEHNRSVSSKCSCGCSGDKDKCNKNCNERKRSVSSKCSCGCSGDKDKCTKNCDERKKSESTQCKCGYSGDKDKCSKNGDERKKNLPKCFCGCSGDEDKCNKNCTERKNILPKDKDRISPRCACGCKGDIKNCKKNCEQRKTGLCTQCSCGCFGNKENCNKYCDELKKSSKEVGIQKDSTNSSCQTPDNDCSLKPPDRKKQNDCGVPSTSKNVCEINSKSSDKYKTSESETDKETDPVLEMIQNITKKYSKTDFEKGKRKKCFKEIMSVLKYLLETEDSTNRTEDQCVTSESSTNEKPENTSPCLPKKQEKTSQKPKRPCITTSSDCPQSTDIPGTSSDSATCKVLNKIKKECERYHQKRCKVHSGKKCDISSSTSAHCDQCRRVHHCFCRNHKCKVQKKCEKIQKKAVAYNLILQTTESISEETVCTDKVRQLKNIVVKVPSQRKQCGNVPFKEMCAKIESRMPPCSPCEPKPCRSKSLPNESEISSMEEFLRKSQAYCTVREYLEQNRPDFIAKSSQRQNCLRIVNDSRENLRAAQRDLLSMRLAQLSDVNDLDSAEIRQLAEELGRHMRQKRPAPKFISERSMKKHSQIIYQSLPEVIQKKEEARKENIKKTNLLMANIFKKNLQKKTLRGSVDISNYSPIIKI